MVNEPTLNTDHAGETDTTRRNSRAQVQQVAEALDERTLLTPALVTSLAEGMDVYGAEAQSDGSFVFTTGDYLLATEVPDYTQPFTFDVTVTPDDLGTTLGNSPALVYVGDENYTDFSVMVRPDGSLFFPTGPRHDMVIPQTYFAAGRKTRLTAVVDPRVQEAVFYVDGVEVQRMGNFPAIVNGRATLLGKHATGMFNAFAGTMHDLKMYQGVMIPEVENEEVAEGEETAQEEQEQSGGEESSPSSAIVSLTQGVVNHGAEVQEDGSWKFGEWDYLEVTEAIDFSQSVTFDMTITPEQLAGAQGGVISPLYIGDVNVTHGMIFVEPNGGGQIKDGGNTWYTFDAGHFADGQTTRLTLTYDAESGEGTLYIDTHEVLVMPHFTPFPNGHAVRFGNHPLQNGNGYYYQFKGVMHDLGIYEGVVMPGVEESEESTEAAPETPASLPYIRTFSGREIINGGDPHLLGFSSWNGSSQNIILSQGDTLRGNAIGSEAMVIQLDTPSAIHELPLRKLTEYGSVLVQLHEAESGTYQEITIDEFGAPVTITPDPDALYTRIDIIPRGNAMVEMHSINTELAMPTVDPDPAYPGMSAHPLASLLQKLDTDAPMDTSLPASGQVAFLAASQSTMSTIFREYARYKALHQAVIDHSDDPELIAENTMRLAQLEALISPLLDRHSTVAASTATVVTTVASNEMRPVSEDVDLGTVSSVEERGHETIAMVPLSALDGTAYITAYAGTGVDGIAQTTMTQFEWQEIAPSITVTPEWIYSGMQYHQVAAHPVIGHGRLHIAAQGAPIGTRFYVANANGEQLGPLSGAVSSTEQDTVTIDFAGIPEGILSVMAIDPTTEQHHDAELSLRVVQGNGPTYYDNGQNPVQSYLW